jgi:hypothetical protein
MYFPTLLTTLLLLAPLSLAGPGFPECYNIGERRCRGGAQYREGNLPNSIYTCEPWRKAGRWKRGQVCTWTSEKCVDWVGESIKPLLVID